MSHFSRQLEDLLSEAKSNIARIPLSEMEAKAAPTRWSKKEILGHLLDSAIYNLKRFTEALMVPPPYTLEGYPQDQLVVTKKYQQQEVASMLRWFLTLNEQVLSIFDLISETQWKIPVETPNKWQVHNLEELVEDYLRHMRHHLRQIYNQPQELDEPAFHITQESAMIALQKVAPEFVTLLERGKLEVELYQPDQIDKQKPHDKDELYVIISGEGEFINGDHKHPFKPHDVIFVPAQVEHRFVNFSEDFKTWVIFY